MADESSEQKEEAQTESSESVAATPPGDASAVASTETAADADGTSGAPASDGDGAATAAATEPSAKAEAETVAEAEAAAPSVEAEGWAQAEADGGTGAGVEEAEPVVQAELSEEVRRILRIEVPVIVKLAEKRLPLGDILGFMPGAIVEFEKHAAQPLALLVNNKTIGHGVAVKVGEKFGLRVDVILPVEETIRKLGN